MASSTRFKAALGLFVLGGFCAVSLYAQTIYQPEEQTNAPSGEELPPASEEPQTGFSRVEGSGRDVRIIQHLSWEPDEYAYRYEVVVEKRENGLYEEELRLSTEDPFIEVSLVPGFYRYKVQVYDLLDRLSMTTDWAEFEIFLAIQPSLRSMSPTIFYIDDDTVWNITAQGRNILPDAEAYLRISRTDGGDTGRRIVPRRISVSGDTISLEFDMQQLVPGTWELVARNPGGLESVLGPFTIAYRKAMDINVSGGYNLALPLYSRINELYSPVQPLGFSARASIVPFKRVIGALGAEASLYWNYLSGEAEDYNMNAHLAGLDVKVLVQWALYQRMLFLNIRAGGGLGSMINFHFEYYDGTNSEPPLTVFMPSVGGGLSLQWLFYRHAFVEAGAEFTHYFSVDSISPAYIKPGIHFGWQF